MKRYDANVNITIMVPDEQAVLDEVHDPDDEENVDVEDALMELLESEQPTFEIGLSGANAFIVAAERVTYLDG